MKKSPGKILTTIILVTVISFAVKAQTYISGGIFTNTTWTAANSPYIVVDTTVVFPGVTLTIEPGVTVKFENDTYLEIRQGTFIAIGTITDSITFTSNSLSPTPGIWGHNSNGGIWLNTNSPIAINFWNVSYATRSIQAPSYIIQYIKNSSFTYNQYGIHDVSYFPVDSCIFKFNTIGIANIHNSTLNNCTISNNYNGVEESGNVTVNNCIIESNQRAFGGVTGYTGDTKFHYCIIRYNVDGIIGSKPSGGNLFQNCVIDSNSAVGIGYGMNAQDTIINCEIKYNGTGIGVFSYSSNWSLITQCEIEYNTIGVSIVNIHANIFCNKICNNTSYGLQLNTPANFNVANNYWCTTDSAQIAAAIYDGYDNVSNGLVTFMPIDTTQCYLTTSINEIENHKFNFTVFPNPAFDNLTLVVSGNVSKAELNIFNILGELEYPSTLVQSRTTIDVSTLSAGIHIIQVAAGNKISRQKFIKQ